MAARLPVMDDDISWSNLVVWLRSKGLRDNELLVCSKPVPDAGRGLFAAKDVPPNTPLFTIPRSAHMNIKTLTPLYKSLISSGVVLSATQMISMHIFLHRPNYEDGGNSLDPTFGPYISILPRNFEGHPLLWRITPEVNSGPMRFILSAMPHGVDMALKELEHRFWQDWKAVSELLNQNSNLAISTRRPDICLSPFIPEHHVPGYLWAWLNVNTRCVYSRISSSPSDPNNITLCPVLDLANHTSDPTYAPRTTPFPTFFSPEGYRLKEGQEIFLRYGSHSNSTLFTEYGFIETDRENGGQADVQDIIETLFRKKGPLGEWMKTTLTEANYWGDWKLYENPAPAHPSYRLLPALRLLHLSLPPFSDTDAKFDDAPELVIWRECLVGDVDIVSPENEKLVWKTLEDICRESALRTEESHQRLEERILAHQFVGWMKHAAQTISSLWLEEKRVSQAVAESIVKGEGSD